MSLSNELALVVNNEVAGSLDTNIAKLEGFVRECIKRYSPEFYNDAEVARKDRAELNKAKKALGDARREIMERLMRPYVDFETRCKALEKEIEAASGKLDDIVKVKETEEKEAKRRLVEAEWESRNFTLVPLSKVFNPKWLNKTFKMSDVAQEMSVTTERILSDLKTIERFSDDAENMKAHYLMCLDIGDTLDYGEELKKKRELARREAEERAHREHEERLDEQRRELREEQESHVRREAVAGLAADALGEGEVKPAPREYVLTMSLTETELLGVKNYLNMQGIEFECRELEF